MSNEYIHLVTSKFREKRRDITLLTTNTKGCVLATGWTKKGVKDYRVLALGIRHLQESAHVSAWIASRGTIPNNQVSHLCHENACIKFSHLADETQEENLDRNMCQRWTWINCPCQCGHRFNPCQHQPQCILPQF